METWRERRQDYTMFAIVSLMKNVNIQPNFDFFLNLNNNNNNNNNTYENWHYIFSPLFGGNFVYFFLI